MASIASSPSTTSLSSTASAASHERTPTYRSVKERKFRVLNPAADGAAVRGAAALYLACTASASTDGLAPDSDPESDSDSASISSLSASEDGAHGQQGRDTERERGSAGAKWGSLGKSVKGGLAVLKRKVTLSAKEFDALKMDRRDAAAEERRRTGDNLREVSQNASSP
ncbi:hypothetical protein FA95DRAFT_1675505 [Auriscalpium vulgare]|uniref:Uncharacterized protein n=1 Tax=Auriscalpium vulgare TaxID=40419 RepID=A0ACB8S670_9AGAM|nr:hypothetical protein FA95DRAFT_1675505 [Auriscalpium vulgare]